MKGNDMKRVKARPQPALEQKEDIDTTDIPEWTEEDFSNAIRLNGRSFAEAMSLYRVKKAAISARIDADILEWLKSQGEGYQTRLNAILRTAMLKDLHKHRQQS